jgi:hypothetical protein
MAENTKGARERTVRVHITQDDYGFWMMSLERDDGSLSVASYGAEHPGHDVHHAYHPEEIGLPAETEFLVSKPSVPLRMGKPGWKKPEARRAREPYYIIKNGKRVS